jgi:DNA-binding FadR family transcriptional regulator
MRATGGYHLEGLSILPGWSGRVSSSLAKSQKPYLAIADRLKSMIQRGTYGPGDPLPTERDLSRSLKASRASVREGLVALDILGIVERRRGEGWVVRRTPDAWLDVAAVEGRSPSEILQARLLVECAAVERVTLQHNDEDLTAMQRAVNDFDAEVARREYQGKADRHFHVLVARTSNAVFGDVVAYLWDLQNADLFKRVERLVGQEYGRIERYAAEHRRIFQGIAALDAPLAREEMRRHLEGVYQDLLGADNNNTT